MLRFFGVIMIFMSCSIFGISMSQSMKKKLERLNFYRRMTDEISTLIRFRSLTIREIIEQLKMNSAYGEINFLNSMNYMDRSRPATDILLDGIRNDNTLGDDEKKILSQLASQLGTTDTQGQLSVIGVFDEELEAMIAEQSDRYAVRGKLCRSMGILVGAMLSVMII